MTILARPNHPARLAGIFASSIAAFAVLAAAAAAVMYIVNSERGGGAPAASSIEADVELPPGMVLIRRIGGAEAWVRELGFEPVEAAALPTGVDAEPLYFLEQPDSTGTRAGHVRYPDSGGGLLVVLVQQAATIADVPGMDVTETESGRAYVQWVPCGAIAVQAQLFFSLDSQAPPASETAGIAEAFVAGLQEQCR